MPKKKGKGGDEDKVIQYGRFKSHLKMGIVGLPNVGKSSFFNLLTECSVPAENFPFCTIEPTTARVLLPDERFDWLLSTFSPKSQVPAFLEVTDIAGLVKGASAGEGLGNAFLSTINGTDGIFQMVRLFEDAEVVDGSGEGVFDPLRDLDIIKEELLLKDLDFVEAALQKLRNPNKGTKQTPAMVADLATVEGLFKFMTEERQWARNFPIRASQIDVINSLFLLTTKPTIYLLNMTEKGFCKKKSSWLPKVDGWIKTNNPSAQVLPLSVAFEEQIQHMSEEDSAAYCAEKKAKSQVGKIITKGFKAMDLIYFFTAGEDEVKCWTLRKGSKAPQAAGTIHTDFEKGFICAEVMSFDDLREFGSEGECRAKGKYRQEGKEYVVQDGDVINFKFNVSTAKK